LKIEQVKLDALIPYARNSRTHSDAQAAQIAASIKEFGFTNPVLIDETGSIAVMQTPIYRSDEAQRLARVIEGTAPK
jgi:hypothetical protein